MLRGVSLQEGCGPGVQSTNSPAGPQQVCWGRGKKAAPLHCFVHLLPPSPPLDCVIGCLLGSHWTSHSCWSLRPLSSVGLGYWLPPWFPLNITFLLIPQTPLLRWTGLLVASLVPTEHHIPADPSDPSPPLDWVIGSLLGSHWTSHSCWSLRPLSSVGLGYW